MIKNGKPYTCERGHTDFNLMSDGETMGHMGREEFERQVFRWIDMFVSPARRTNNRESSYSLKHKVENWATGGLYITNNQFKDAMMIKGYMPVDENEINMLEYFDAVVRNTVESVLIISQNKIKL